jgi:hypothetical protein
MEKMKFKTREEAFASIKKGDRLYYDCYIDEYFIVSPRKYIWKEGEFEENFLMMPETFEECSKLRSENCQYCTYLPQRLGPPRSCRRGRSLSNRSSMEIFKE